jgi:ABC-type sugar transport system permease subunit
LAGLDPEEYCEAAKIDGAGLAKLHICHTVTSLFFLLVVMTLSAFQTFTEVTVDWRWPVNSTDVMQEIFRSFYFNGQYGLASAQALVLFVIILALTIIQFGVLEKRVNYE